MKTFMEKAKRAKKQNYGQKWNCPQHQLRWNQIANQTSQRPNKQKVKLTSRQKMNLSSLGNKDMSKFGNEKWNELLMWKVKWKIEMKSESEHMNNWNGKWKWTHEKLKLKVNKLGNGWQMCVRKMRI